MGNENNLVSCCGSDFLPDTHPVEHVGLKTKTRSSVRLTEQAHILLVDIAKRNKVSMKTVGSEAIFTSERAPKAEKMYRKRIEELKFKALKSKQLAIFYMLLVGVTMGLLGFVIGLVVK